MTTRFLNIHEASELLQVHPQTTRAYIHAGKLKAYKVGNRHLFLMVDLVEFVKNKKIKNDNNK